MNALTKFTLGLMENLQPKAVLDDAVGRIALPAPQTQGGMPLLEVISKRHSAREIKPSELALPMLQKTQIFEFGWDQVSWQKLRV